MSAAALPSQKFQIFLGVSSGSRLRKSTRELLRNISCSIYDVMCEFHCTNECVLENLSRLSKSDQNVHLMQFGIGVMGRGDAGRQILGAIVVADLEVAGWAAFVLREAAIRLGVVWRWRREPRKDRLQCRRSDVAFAKIFW